VLAIQYSLTHTLATELGAIDWIVSLQSKTRHYMTPLNDDGRSGGEPFPLPDRVSAYTRVDVGAGYASRAGSFEVRGFINNLTNINYMTSFQSPNTRYLTPPRLFGVSLTVHF
jgi:outer membrane receptor protein involved in Fe transport